MRKLLMFLFILTVITGCGKNESGNLKGGEKKCEGDIQEQIEYTDEFYLNNIFYLEEEMYTIKEIENTLQENEFKEDYWGVFKVNIKVNSENAMKVLENLKKVANRESVFMEDESERCFGFYDEQYILYEKVLCEINREYEGANDKEYFGFVVYMFKENTDGSLDVWLHYEEGAVISD